MALIALLAAAAVPGSVGSQGPSPAATLDATPFQGVDAASIDGPAAMTPALDPAYRSDGAHSDTPVLLDTDERPAPAGRPDAARIQPDAPVGSVSIPQWHLDSNVSWYGPGFYGNRTACGYAMTKTLVGVAHRTLPCGTKVTFRHNGRVLRVPVIDRGPYVGAREYDLTAATARKLGFSGHGPVDVTR
jgi:hypothetical protein